MEWTPTWMVTWRRTRHYDDHDPQWSIWPTLRAARKQYRRLRKEAETAEMDVMEVELWSTWPCTRKIAGWDMRHGAWPGR